MNARLMPVEREGEMSQHSMLCSCNSAKTGSRWRERFHVPDPAPVTMAVLPARERAIRELSVDQMERWKKVLRTVVEARQRGGLNGSCTLHCRSIYSVVGPHYTNILDIADHSSPCVVAWLVWDLGRLWLAREGLYSSFAEGCI